MTTYNIYNANGEYLGSIKAASTTILERIVKSVYGPDAKAVKS